LPDLNNQKYLVVNDLKLLKKVLVSFVIVIWAIYLINTNPFYLCHH